MEITKAMQIIEQLADGTDPHTGELFPDDSPYQRAEVVRALTLAAKGLSDLQQRNRRRERLPRNAGQPWSLEDDQSLADRFRAGVSIGELAQEYLRTEGAIRSRLIKLGELSED